MACYTLLYYTILYFTQCALEITQRPRTYICEAAPWGSLPYDLRAIALYETGRRQAALEAAEKALAIEPGNARLQGNVQVIAKAVEANK